ncbi:cyclin-O [Callorhinchus milii]|uniref:cyclin-O n=1 Tax=Callorhinchus milii TaxID=7868 RepID=UPI001C3FDE74|nr:cyclin-O [Callorhinchus milii]
MYALCRAAAAMVAQPAVPGQVRGSPAKRKRPGSGQEDVTPEDRAEMTCGSANTRAPVKKPKCPRHRKQDLVSRAGEPGSRPDQPSPSGSADPGSPALGSGWSPPGPTTGLDLQNFREYGEKCFLFKRESEKRFHPRNCLAQQPQVTSEDRCKLVSWLIPVHRYFGFSFESMCLTVNIMDRFLQTTPVASDCFQLIGVTSLLLACKQVEVYPPRVKQLLSLCCDAFTGEQLRNLECIILIKLNFQLAAPGLDFFLEYYSEASGEGQEVCSARAASTQGLARQIAQLSLADYSFNGYPPSLLAMAALRLAERMFQHQEGTSEQPNHDTACALEDCVERLKLLVALNEESLVSLLTLELTHKEELSAEL